jgi:O-antigen ligase
MIVLSRAGWILSAAVFATILASLRHVDYVGLVPVALLALLALLCALRPLAGLEIVAALIPVAWFLAARRWNYAVGWAEAVACAAIVGLSIDAARTAGARRVPFTVSGPALLFGLVVVGSMIASLGVHALRLGPGFTDALWTQMVREYFVDERGFPALHAGMLLLQGTLLFALAARLIAAPAAPSGSPEAAERRLRRLAANVAIGAALAAMLNVGKLVQSALRGDTFVGTLLDLSQQHRWNVHYADFNAAGSFFVMAALAALALAVAVPARRAAWAGGAVLVTAALWLTGSRAAYVAGVLGLAAALLAARVRSVRHGLAAATLTGLGAIALVAVIAALAPQRGNQQSSVLALDTRVGMAKVAAAMIATRPAFGIGLGEFPERAGEFIPPDLAAKFPVAFQENAHNNFLQIAAELGLVGGVFFTWLVAAALFVALRRSRGNPFTLLVTAGLLAFVISWLGGHPLLVPEAAYVFWILLGAAAGAALSPPRPTSRRATAAIAVCAVAIALTVPWRMRAMMDEANLEHVGIGVSLHWQLGPDDVRYREATGHATLFAPARSAFKLRVNPRADGVLKLELKLDGRVADVVTVLPNTWTQLSLPARTHAASARYARFDLRLIDGDQTRMWITKIEPIQ